MSATSFSPSVQLRLQIECGQLNEALAGGLALLRDAPSALSHFERSRVHNELALLMIAKARPLDAMSHALSARDLAREAGATIGAERSERCEEARAALMAAAVNQAVENHAAAMELIDQAQAFNAEQQDPWIFAQALRRKGISCSLLGNHDSALALLEQSSASFVAAGAPDYDKLHARFSWLNARGRANDALPTEAPQRLANYRNLYEAWCELRQECSELGLQRLAVMSLGNVAIAARYCGQHDHAVASLREVAKVYAAQGMRSHESQSLSHIAAILALNGNHLAAVTEYEAAIELLEGGSPRDLHEALMSLSQSYEALDKPREALASYKRAQQLDVYKHDEQARILAAKREARDEISALSAQWSRLAYEDALTGLGNRRGLEAWLAALFTNTDAPSYALLLLDLDHFKKINDTWGHAAGDAVLVQFAELLKARCRSTDLAVRLGGEEFVVVLQLASSDIGLGLAADVAERHRAACQQHDWSAVAARLSVTVSIGVTTCAELPAALPNGLARDAKSDLTYLLGIADRRLYAAKHAGRNAVVAGD